MVMKAKVFKREKTWLFSLLAITAVLAFLAGYGFQRFINARTKLKEVRQHNKRNMYSEIIQKRNFESRDRTLGDVIHEEKQYHTSGIRNVNTSYIQRMHRYFSREPHLAGTQRNLELAQFMVDEWKPYEFDRVELKEYDILLSYPRNPANISLRDADGRVLYQLKMTEEAFYPEENSTHAVYPFNAYSASGDVEGEYIFVNFGDVKDYMWLKDHNVNVAGKIVIAKYGAAFRGEKARLAQLNGAVGLMLYSDPEDYTTDHGIGYPNTWDLPAIAIQRGNIANVKGDPLTPKYPSKEGMYRIREDKVPHFTKIPVQPISYRDAQIILSVMDGVEVPDPDWQGGLNFTYRVNSKTPRRIRMIIDTPKERRKIQNVVATIKGDVEPDRLVILGNHRDSWVYGAGDPSSGTACLMEIARSLSIMLKDGWRPRRTIMLISWDAEEYGLMGSSEWVEEYAAVLASRAVAYINVDIAVSGNYSVRAKASPQLSDKLFDIAKMFADPDFRSFDASTSSLYDSWAKKFPSPTNIGEPRIRPLGSGSDFTRFYSSLGIVAVDWRYTYNEIYYSKLGNYPTYHTIYDNFNYYTKFIDPEYKYHAVVTKLLMETTLDLADDILLPFNISRYARQIINDTDAFDYSFMEMMQPQNVSMADVRSAAYSLLYAANKFHRRLLDVNKNSCYEVRRINDQMMFFERAFIVPEGLRGKPHDKHILWSPARKVTFNRRTFPGLTELLYDIEADGQDLWDDVREHLSEIVYALNNAEQVIADFGVI